MKVLVCGGAGYIGSNMTALLTHEGHEPIVFDNFSKGHKSAIGHAEFVQGVEYLANIVVHFRQHIGMVTVAGFTNEIRMWQDG